MFCKARTSTGAWLSQRSTEIHGMVLMGAENLTASGHFPFPTPQLNSCLLCLEFIPFSLLLAGMPTSNTNGIPTTFNPQQPHQYPNPHLHKPYLMEAFPTHHCSNTMAPNTGCDNPAARFSKTCMAYGDFSHCCASKQFLASHPTPLPALKAQVMIHGVRLCIQHCAGALADLG